MQVPKAVQVKEFSKILQKIAPLEYSESWDNTGMLVLPDKRSTIKKVLLCIDLTPEVLREALKTRVQMVVSYHPPIFSGLKTLLPDDPKTGMILKAVQKNIAIYSPHTALDVVAGGVNDWLADGLGEGKRQPIQPLADDPSQGQGRLVTLDKPISPTALRALIKKRLGLKQLRVCHPHNKSVRTVALCAGSGISVLAGVEADAYWTGEMKHHDVLAAQAAGIHVYLSEHTHTERGYLKILRRALLKESGKSVEVLVSKVDKDPLTIR